MIVNSDCKNYDFQPNFHDNIDDSIVSCRDRQSFQIMRNESYTKIAQRPNEIHQDKCKSAMLLKNPLSKIKLTND